MKFKPNYLLFIPLLLISQLAQAQLRVARLFSNNAVLQRQKPIPVWGWANAGQSITVSIAGQSQSTKADATGAWRVSLPALEAGGPHNLNITDGTSNLQISEVLIGEVWLLSGQSNMEWRLRSAKDYAKEKKDANYPNIRHFFVEHEVSMSPQTDLPSGSWAPASTETVGEFSAIGFLFARELYQKLNIPIGLVHSSWGGSQIEGWISKEAMLGSTELASYAKNMPSNWLEADAQIDARLRKQVFGQEGFNPDLAYEAKYTSQGYDYGKWTSTSPLGQWDWKGYFSYRGTGYMAKNIEVTAAMAAKPSILGLGIQNGRNKIYINGRLVADTTITGLRTYKLPPGSWRVGNNQLVVKMEPMAEPKYYGLGLMGSPADLYLSAGNDRIDLADAWQLRPSFAEPHNYTHSANNVGTTIYNGMIAPLIPYAMRGCLWYQGESNTNRAYQYRQSFPLLISDWRKRWADDFSFYWVQLSSYGPYPNSNQGSGWAELREAQTMALSLPNTGQAITTDIGNPADIHPTNKQDVAHRLALIALKQNYGQNIQAYSPMYQSVIFKKGKAIVNFTNTGTGLSSQDRYGYLKGFEIAGADKKFVYAQAIVKGNTVEVFYPGKKKPKAVRYAWTDAPDDANLYNSEGLPACPFRTDNWAGITYGKRYE
jgi:sialate O-acetylesterase